MIGMKVAVLALCACVIGVAAQDATPTPSVQPTAAPAPPMMDPSAMIAYESFVGQKILSLHLKIQTAQHMTFAGTTYFSLMMQSMQSGPREQPIVLNDIGDGLSDDDSSPDLDSDSTEDDIPVVGVVPPVIPIVPPVIPVPVVIGSGDDLDVDSSDTPSDDDELEIEDDLGDSDSEGLNLLEFSNTLNADLEEGGSVYLDPDHQTIKAKQSLLAAYHLFFATKHWMHKTIFQAGEMQQEYWADRAMQMQAQAFGAALPPQLVQMLYLRSFRTHMETLKLSQQLQTISHFIMWLEDEIDVGKALSMDDPTFHNIVLDDQSDDIVQDKMFAFNSFNTYAMLDLQIFYIDMYLQYMLAATTQAAAGAPAGSSFLEVEEKPFLPFALGLGAGGNPQAMQQFIFIMSLYRVMYQMYSAHAGMTSAMAESVANHHDDTDPNKAYTFRTFARQSFGSFGMFLMNMANIDMYIGILELSSFSGQGGGMGGGMGMM